MNGDAVAEGSDEGTDRAARIGGGVCCCGGCVAADSGGGSAAGRGKREWIKVQTARDTGRRAGGSHAWAGTGEIIRGKIHVRGDESWHDGIRRDRVELPNV